MTNIKNQNSACYIHSKLRRFKINFILYHAYKIKNKGYKIKNKGYKIKNKGYKIKNKGINAYILFIVIFVITNNHFIHKINSIPIRHRRCEKITKLVYAPT